MGINIGPIFDHIFISIGGEIKAKKTGGVLGMGGVNWNLVWLWFWVAFGLFVFMIFAGLLKELLKKKGDNNMLVPEKGIKKTELDLLSLRAGTPDCGQPWEVKVQGKARVIVGYDNEGVPLVASGEIASITDVEAATFENQAIGKVELGLAPARYQQWSYVEKNGGVLVVLYTVINGNLLFGVIPEKRFLILAEGQAQTVYGFPGGFVQEDEGLEEAALRELEEETGLTGGFDMIHVVDPQTGIKCTGTVANRAFFYDADDRHTQKTVALYISSESLKEDGEGRRTLNIACTPELPTDNSPEANDRKKVIKFASAVSKAFFVPWSDLAVYGRDGLVLTSAMRILGAYEKGWLTHGGNSAVNYNFLGGHK